MKLRTPRFQKAISIFFLAVLISSFTVANYSVFATDSFSSGNDILFYDPDDSGISSNCVSGGTITAKVWNYLISKGLTEAQTAGVMGNMYQESNISPTAWQHTDVDILNNQGGRAWGIVQWDKSRRYDTVKDDSGQIIKVGVLGSLLENTDLDQYVDQKYSGGSASITKNSDGTYTLAAENLLDSKNIPEADLDELLYFELDYLWMEFPSNGLDHVKAATTVIDATVAFHDGFERSSDSAEFVRTVRGGYSQAIYNKYHNSTTGGYSSECNESGFVTTVKKYAWENFKGWYKYSPVLGDDGIYINGNYAIIPTDAYKVAVEKAKSEGRYTGDSCFGGGIDCGAFVTILVNDSGFDVNYNYSGLYSKGAGNTATQKKWLDTNWQSLGEGKNLDASILQPGDIAIYNDGNEGHVLIYVGNIDGFGGVTASASQCQRAPMATQYELKSTLQSDSKYTWYRKK